MYKKNKKRYGTIYIPQELEATYNSCMDMLHGIDCNLSKLLFILIPLITKLAIQIIKARKNFRHYRFEIVARDHGTGVWISSSNDVDIKDRLE